MTTRERCGAYTLDPDGCPAHHVQEGQQEVLGARVVVQPALQDGDLLLGGARLHALAVPRRPAGPALTSYEARVQPHGRMLKRRQNCPDLQARHAKMGLCSSRCRPVETAAFARLCHDCEGGWFADVQASEPAGTPVHGVILERREVEPELRVPRPLPRGDVELARPPRRRLIPVDTTSMIQHAWLPTRFRRSMHTIGACREHGAGWLECISFAFELNARLPAQLSQQLELQQRRLHRPYRCCQEQQRLRRRCRAPGRNGAAGMTAPAATRALRVPTMPPAAAAGPTC